MELFLIDVPVPSMGATVNELTIVDIKVQPGARVAKGEKIAELESDKSVFEFEAPCDGVIAEINCRAGDILPSGAPFLRIETADASLRHLEAKESGGPVDGGRSDSRTVGQSGGGRTADGRGRTADGRGQKAEPATTAAVPVIESKIENPKSKIQWTPRATKLAQEAGLDPATLVDIEATGPGGRVSGDDVARYLAARPAPRESQISNFKSQIAVSASAETETVRIAGLGYAVPKNVMSNREILKEFPGRTEAEIVKLTGIKERRHAEDDESATDLAAIAVQHALAQAGVPVQEIDGIIMATLIPDQPVPSMASKLAKLLGIPHALAFDLNAACSGWLYALEVGRAFIRSGTAKNILVVTAELLSRITNPKDKETAFLFGDGAGAAVLTAAPGGHRLHRMALSGDARLFEAIQRPGGGALNPVPHPAGHDRDSFYLQMNGGVVFRAAVVAFADQIEGTLARENLRPEDVAWIVPHQANERILRAVSKRVGIPFEKFIVTISQYGNTSAASVSMALGWAAEEGIFHAGDKIVFCSVGAGLTFAGGLLVW